METPKGYKITEHPKHREAIEGMMKNNGGYCPCQKEQNEDTKCICKTFQETGECHCGYFIRI